MTDSKRHVYNMFSWYTKTTSNKSQHYKRQLDSLKMIKLLKNCLSDISEVEGDLIDFGVYNGDNFIRIAKLNNVSKRKIIGVVNYSGLEEPSEWDVENDGSIS